MKRQTPRPALVLAFSWLLASVVLTLLLAPSLGARGLMWRGLHNALCVFGCSWEVRRAGRLQQRVRGRLAEE